MKSTSISTLVFLALGTLFALTGCGGGGGGGSTPSTPSTPVVDNNNAPSTLNTRSIVFADPDLATVTTTYNFTFSNYTTNGDSGVYSYSRNDAVRHTANLQIASSFAPVLFYQLTFTTTGGGTYLDTASQKTAAFILR